MSEKTDSNSVLPKQTESTALIRFQDCDPLRHLNNAKYFDYFFNAREDQLARMYGFNYAEIFERYGCGWVAYNHDISYIRPAMVSERVTIISRLIFANNDTLVTEYLMLNHSKTELKCLMWTTAKYVDILTGKRTNHQPEVMEQIQRMLYPDIGYGSITKTERIRQIKNELLTTKSS
jgi:acyl-CoA thioester hydrolase